MKTMIFTGLLGLFSFFSQVAHAQLAKPNDAQIAAIVVAANTVDINAGKLAQKQASDQTVKAFAKQMVTDHTGVNKEASDLVKKLNLTPEDNESSNSLKKDGEATIEKLKSMKAKEFDRAYIDNEVKYHQSVIDTMDNTLIPSAQHASLKSLLLKVRPAFVSHLEHAKKLQSSMK